MDKIDNCIVILDRFTKEVVDEISYFDITNSAIVLDDLAELDETADGKKIILFEPILYQSVTVPLVQTIMSTYNCSFVIAYSTDDISTPYASFCTLIKCSYNVIDVNLIYALAMNDNIILNSYKSTMDTINLYRNAKMKIPREHQKMFDILHESLISLSIRYNELVVKLTETQRENEILDEQFKRIKKGITELNDYYENMHFKINAYETRLSSSYDKAISGEYNDKPVVLYFKEYQNLPGFDLLLNVLYYVLTVQYHTSCKVVKLIDTTCAKQMQFIPETYAILENTYNNKDVFLNDFIIKRGAYDQILDTLLLNRTKLKCLVIHDMRGTAKAAIGTKHINSLIPIVSPEFLQFFKDTVCLSSSAPSESEHLVWSIKSYSNIKVKDRLQALSTHQTILSILERLI